MSGKSVLFRIAQKSETKCKSLETQVSSNSRLFLTFSIYRRVLISASIALMCFREPTYPFLLSSGSIMWFTKTNFPAGIIKVILFKQMKKTVV